VWTLCWVTRESKEFPSGTRMMSQSKCKVYEWHFGTLQLSAARINAQQFFWGTGFANERYYQGFRDAFKNPNPKPLNKYYSKEAPV
jgi:hypothetical protein